MKKWENPELQMLSSKYTEETYPCGTPSGNNTLCINTNVKCKYRYDESGTPYPDVDAQGCGGPNIKVKLCKVNVGTGNLS